MSGATQMAASARPLLLRQRTHLAALERDWKRLASAAAADNPFLSWEWQSGWLAARPEVEPLVVAEARADGTLAGLLALQRVRRHGLRQLEFLGQGSGGDELDCLLHPGADAGLPHRLLGAALGAGGWDLLRLESAHPRGALAPALAARPACQARAGEWLPYLRLPASFELLLQGHSANFRAEIRRRRRQFQKAAPAAALDCATTPRAVAAAMDDLFRLHNLRRAQKSGAGIFESPTLRAFHLRAATQLAARGGCRVYLLRNGSEVLAALYGFSAGADGGHAGARGGRFLYFQSGFDPAWTASSPGTVLMSHVIEDCVARGESQFEFLRGDEYYKGRWTTARRQSLEWRGHHGWRAGGYLAARAWAVTLRAAVRARARALAPPPAPAATPAGANSTENHQNGG